LPWCEKNAEQRMITVKRNNFKKKNEWMKQIQYWEIRSLRSLYLLAFAIL
jgi:hypothetical protein